MTSSTRSGAPAPHALFGLAATAWSLIFAAVHVWWAAGGQIGLPADVDMRADPVLFAVDLAAIPLCLLAAFIANASRRRSGTGRPDWAGAGCGLIAAFCLLHSVPPLALGLESALTGPGLPQTGRDLYGLLLYEPWWFLGGALFLGAALTTLRR